MSSKPELLVHVTAPSSVDHDRRFLAVAQSIVDFHPSHRKKISSNDQIRSTALTRPRSTSRGLHLSVPGENATACLQQWMEPAHSHVSGTADEESRGSKRAHISATSTAHQRSSLYATTPAGGFLRTAPSARSDRVQVPFTGGFQRHSFSKSRSLDSLPSVVIESQILPNHSPISHTEIQLPNVQFLCKEDKSTYFSSQQQHTEHRHKRRRLSLGSNVQLAVQASQKLGNAYFLRDRSLDWTSSETSSDTSFSTSLSSTASLSHSLHLRPDTNSENIELGFSERNLLIDLTKSFSSNDGTKGPIRSQIQQKRSEHLSESDYNVQENNDSGGKPEANRRHSEYSSLPRQVSGPTPMIGVHSTFRTHITKSLETIASRLPLSRYFRPLHITRDVKNFERGYWHCPIKVASSKVVTKYRASRRALEAQNPDKHPLRGSNSRERSKKPEPRRSLNSSQTAFDHLWTHTEFLQFWHSIADFIGDGKAGWATRLVREAPRIDPLVAGSSIEVTTINLMIFSWGEIVGHLWLALWILSDKLITRVPMTWISAENAVIIAMSGSMTLPCNLGHWTTNGPSCNEVLQCDKDIVGAGRAR